MNFGVHVLPKVTTTYNLGSTDKKWNNIYGTLKGNADSATYATNVRITETNPSSATTYYPNFTTGVAANTNYALRGTKHYYLYDAGTAATGVYLNVGAANYKGGLTLHTNSSYYGDITPTTLTANRTYTLPNASGTVALTSNLSSYVLKAGDTMTGILTNSTNIWAGIDANGNNVSSGECDIGTGGPSGKIYFYNTSGGRGIYGFNSSSTGAYILTVDSNNNVSLNGNAATATKANGLADGTSTMTSAYSKAGLAYGDYTWLAGWNGYELRAINKSQFAQASHTHNEAGIAFGHNSVYAGDTTIFGALYNDKLRGNRLAGFKPAGVTIEYSTNSGSSWTTYTVADSVKKALFTQGTSLRVVPSGTNMASGCWLRITLDTNAGQVYTFLTKFLIYLTTNYSSNCRVTIDAATHGSPTNFSHVICTDRALSGWSGWNDIGCGFTTYGNTSSQYQKIRFVFKQDGASSGHTGDGLIIMNIRAYGGVGWTTPSYLAANDAPYVYNEEGDITCQRYLTATKVYGAVWNDYAEYRTTKDIIEPGYCVIETGKDDLILSTERLQPGAEIVSDTFGFAIGETDTAKTPIATTGRVLAYIYEGREAALAAIGKPVCSGPNGTVSIMTDEEYQKYGYCAIGTISAVPDYEEWGTGNIKVNNRIWIRIR